MKDSYEDEEPLAVWEAVFLPDWTWVAYEKKSDRYYGRVRSPYTHGNWEWGYFTQEQLEEAGAYRLDDKDELFPDGGLPLNRDPLECLDEYLEGDEE